MAGPSCNDRVQQSQHHKRGRHLPCSGSCLSHLLNLLPGPHAPHQRQGHAPWQACSEPPLSQPSRLPAQETVRRAMFTSSLYTGPALPCMQGLLKGTSACKVGHHITHDAQRVAGGSCCLDPPSASGSCWWWCPCWARFVCASAPWVASDARPHLAGGSPAGCRPGSPHRPWPRVAGRRSWHSLRRTPVCRRSLPGSRGRCEAAQRQTQSR